MLRRSGVGNFSGRLELEIRLRQVDNMTDWAEALRLFTNLMILG